LWASVKEPSRKRKHQWGRRGGWGKRREGGGGVEGEGGRGR